jgi:hypothetical protein
MFMLGEGVALIAKAGQGPASSSKSKDYVFSRPIDARVHR